VHRFPLGSFRTGVTAFNSLDDHGRVTTVLLSFQHAFEMLLKAALEAKKVPCLRQAQREVDFVGDSRGQDGIDDLSPRARSAHRAGL